MIKFEPLYDTLLQLITMKKLELRYPYPLHLHFESPIWDFFNEEDNEKIITQIMDERTESKNKKDAKNFQEFLFELKSVSELSGWEFKEWEIYVSDFYLIFKKIIENYFTNLHFSVDSNVIICILKWWMSHEYYTTGKYWEQLVNKMEQEFETWERELIELRNDLVAFDMEEMHDKSFDFEAFYSYVNALESWNPEDVTPENVLKVNEYRSKDQRRYKFSEEGISRISKTKIDKDIIKWFKQIRIKRETRHTIWLLIAIISWAYFTDELFLYFNPRLFELWICDRKQLILQNTETYIVVNFSNIINSIFCKNCLKEAKKKFGIKTKRDIENNPELIKSMFDEIADQLINVCPDHVEVAVTGKVKDNSKITEIDSKLPNADYVGFEKHSWKKVWVKFNIDDNLQNFKERLKRQ